MQEQITRARSSPTEVLFVLKSKSKVCLHPHTNTHTYMRTHAHTGMCWPETHTDNTAAVHVVAGQFYPIRLRYQSGCGGGFVDVRVCVNGGTYTVRLWLRGAEVCSLSSENKG